MLTEKDILKDIRESFEASGDHLSDDFLSDANLEKAEKTFSPVYEKKERNYRPLFYSLASAAAVFSLIVAFHVHSLGKQFEHQIENPVVTTEENFTGTTRDELSIENITDSTSVSGTFGLTYDTSVNGTSEISQFITDINTGTNRVETENTGVQSAKETSNTEKIKQTENKNTDHPVTSSHSFITENEFTKQVTSPFSTGYVTELEYTTRLLTMPETTTEATTRANPVTEPFTLPWWYYETVQCSAVTDDSPYMTEMECTTPTEEVLVTTSECPEITDVPVETTAAVTYPPSETEVFQFMVIEGSEYFTDNEPLMFEDDEYFYTVEHPEKYTVIINETYQCSLEYVIRNKIVPIDKLISYGIPCIRESK